MRITSWLSARSGQGASEYQKIATAEEYNGTELGRKWKRRFHVLSTAYALTMLCVLIAYYMESKNKTLLNCGSPSDALLGHIPREAVLFTPSDSETAPGTAASEVENATLWDNLQPRGGGFIGVNDPRKYGLVGGFPLERGAKPENLREGYGISMFHQIHCLQAIRSAVHTRTFKDQHLDHCFDYLRQAIMCAGDTTLEKVRVDEHGAVQPEIDGWGTVHQCRSWNVVFEYAERLRVKVEGD